MVGNTHHNLAVLVVVSLITLLILALASCVPAPSQPAAGARPVLSTAVAVSEEAGLSANISPVPIEKPGGDVLSDELAGLIAAYRAGDEQELVVLIRQYGGDAGKGTVRVVLEMTSDPDIRLGEPRVEVLTLKDGSQTEIQHAPEVMVRPDLAAAIADAGAVLETAYENLVQVLTPVSGLEALSQIPGVSRIRLPYPVDSQ